MEIENSQSEDISWEQILLALIVIVLIDNVLICYGFLMESIWSV